MLLVMEKTVLATDHHRNLTEVNVGKQALPRDTLTILCIVDKGRLDANIYKERRCIGEVA